MAQLRTEEIVLDYLNLHSAADKIAVGNLPHIAPETAMLDLAVVKLSRHVYGPDHHVDKA